MAMIYELTDTLDEEVKRLQTILIELDPTTQEYKEVALRLQDMLKLRLEQHKSDMEQTEKQVRSDAELAVRARELDIRERELEAEDRRHQEELASKEKDRKNGWLHTAADAILTFIKAGTTVLGTGMILSSGYEFEKTGNVTSTTFKEIKKRIGDGLNFFRPGKN